MTIVHSAKENLIEKENLETNLKKGQLKLGMWPNKEIQNRERRFESKSPVFNLDFVTKWICNTEVRRYKEETWLLKEY